MLETHRVTHSGSTLLPRTARTTLASTQKNEADEVWRKESIALPTQEEGHGQADGEEEEAIKENEETCKANSLPQIIREIRKITFL